MLTICGSGTTTESTSATGWRICRPNSAPRVTLSVALLVPQRKVVVLQSYNCIDSPKCTLKSYCSVVFRRDPKYYFDVIYICYVIRNLFPQHVFLEGELHLVIYELTLGQR